MARKAMFALIGPKRYDVPWRELEAQGLLPPPNVAKFVPQDSDRQMEYALAGKRHQFRIAAENPRKYEVVQSLLQQEAGHRILIIGEYLDQLKQIAARTRLPVVTGKRHS
jgi:DNA excision repair protein ERCC-3